MSYINKRQDTFEALVSIVVMILLIWVVVRCADQIPRPSEQVSRMKHKQGDVVYMKPDSTKAVIDYVGEDTYTIAYMDKFGKRQYESFVEDSELY